MKLTVVVAALALAACAGTDSTEPRVADSPSASVSAAANNWLARADYPSGLYDAASASITNLSTGRSTLYVIGGQTKRGATAGTIIANVRAFDVSANQWTAKTSAPQRIMSSNGAVALGGKIYISGGFTRHWDAANNRYQEETLRTLYMYDPATDRWTRKRDMPVTSVQGVSAAYQHLLYVATNCFDPSVCAGSNGGALWRYTPSSDTWVLLTRTPHEPAYGGGGIVGAKLYLVDDLGDTDIFDITTKTWSSGPKRPHRLCSPAAATLRAKLYLVGCSDDFDLSGVYPMVVFDPKAGSWSQAAAPPVAADGHLWTLSPVMVNGLSRLELVGGEKPGNNWQYIP